jgi:hypothetical protein
MRAFLVLAALVACDGATSPDPNSGQLSFSYSGDVSGTGSFAAVGVLPADPNALDSRGGAAARLEVTALIAASVPRSNAFDFVYLRTGDTVATTNTFMYGCDPFLPGCTTFLFETNGSAHDLGQHDMLCQLTAGTVTVVDISPTRMTGTFAGTGVCEGSGNSSAVTVTNGSFDVPIVAAIPLL